MNADHLDGVDVSFERSVAERKEEERRRGRSASREREENATKKEKGKTHFFPFAILSKDRLSFDPQAARDA